MRRKKVISDEDNKIKEVSFDLLNDIVELTIDVPVVGIVSKLVKLTHSIKDRLFIEKVITFISDTEGLDGVKRKEVLRDIELKMNSRPGEVLLYLIERMDNKQKTSYFSKLFLSRANRMIDTECFFRLSVVLERIPYLDIEKLQLYKSNYYDEFTVDIFLSAGAIHLSKIKNGSNDLDSDKYILTKLGAKMVEILFENGMINNRDINNSIQILGMPYVKVIKETNEVKL